MFRSVRTMKIKKIIIIRYMPLVELIYNKFYMPEIVNEGIDVEYWDVSKIFFGDTSYLEKTTGLCQTVVIDSYSQLINKIRSEDISTTLFHPLMTVEGRLRKLYKIFTKYNCKLLMFGRNVMPLPDHSITTKSIINKIHKITPEKIINKIDQVRLNKEIHAGKIIPFEIVFLGGTYGWMGVGTHNAETLNRAISVVKLNSDDYDKAMVIKNSQADTLVEGGYILFLDEYLPLHPDTLMFDIKNVDPDIYYDQINKYFDKIEAQFNMPVVIAAHPKAQKYKEKNYFNGRTVFFGESARLCKDAEFVIAHDSTSINFAICFDKPLHLITSHDIERVIDIVHNDVLCFSRVIGCNWQYFDQLDSPIDIAPVDSVKYQSYKYNYQTWKETENKQSKDIFIDWLKEHL